MRTSLRFVELVICFLAIVTVFPGINAAGLSLREGCLVWATGAAVVWAAEARVVLLDCSGSVTKGLRSPFGANIEAVRKAILSTPKDSQLYVIGFGKGAPVPFLTATTPKIAGPQGRNLRASVDAALRTFDSNLKDRRAEVNPSGTDVEGCLFRASRLFAESGARTNKVLFIVSDMQQESEEKKFTLRRMTAHQTQLRKTSSESLNQGAVPDLRGVKAYVFSQFNDTKGMSTKNIELAVSSLREYWTAFLKRAGAEIVAYKTASY